MAATSMTATPNGYLAALYKQDYLVANHVTETWKGLRRNCLWPALTCCAWGNILYYSRLNDSSLVGI